MELHRHLLLLIIVLNCSFVGGCSKTGPGLIITPGAAPANEGRATAPARLPVSGGTEVTFYPTYGYKEGAVWKIQVRGWAHTNRKFLNRFITKLATVKGVCHGQEMEIFKSRSDDFEDDDKKHEKVVIAFDADPAQEQYAFKKSDVNGIIEESLSLTEERAQQLLKSQNSANGWLSYRAVSEGHTGLGRIRLIEPEGLSLITDIDDTIKVTEVPAGTETVLRNTFCKEFLAAPGMAQAYRDLGDIPIHYVSGGPQQLFGPLYDFLIKGPGGFPEGTFHLRFIPKNRLSSEARANLAKFSTSSLHATYTHKISEITRLMERFPNRKFILSGDSGEVDPEVYSEIRKRKPEQVREVWIRDVVNDQEANPQRLAGMKIIKVERAICMEKKHFQNLAAELMALHQPEYLENKGAPCKR
jgi:hypothetical protein